MKANQPITASDEMKTVLRAAHDGTELDADSRAELKPSADKAVAKGWIECNGAGENGFFFKMTPEGQKVYDLLKLSA